MATAPLAYCAEPRCSARVPYGRCAAHAPQARILERRHYTGIPGVNYGRKWQKAAKAFLAEHVWCALCPKDRQPRLATEVDHRIPHHGDEGMFWDKANWQPVCKPCHSAKTAREVRRG